jgi:hypothetical protein
MCKGKIDDVRVYNRALTADEIRRLYRMGGTFTVNKTPAPGSPAAGSLGKGLVGYWSFDGADVTHIASSVAGSTGAATPGSNAAVAGRGDGNGFQTTTGSGDLASIDGAGRTDTDSGTGVATDGCGTFPQNEADYHYFTDFNLSVPAGATISGITVTTSASVDIDTGTNRLCVALSPDAGVSTTTAKDTGDIQSGSVTTDTLGSSSDTWGRTWSASEFSDANFRVYIMPDSSGNANRDYFLDQVTVDVAYTVPGPMAASKVVDGSGQGNHGTLTNGPQTTIGKLGQALSFDGTNDYIVIANESNFDFEATDPFSISVWLKPDTTNTLGQNPVVKSLDSGTYTGWHFIINQGVTPLDNNPGRIALFLWNVNGSVGIEVATLNSTNLNDGSWHHYVVTYSGSSLASGIKIYEDSRALTTETGNNNISGDTILNDAAVGLGARSDGAPSNSEFYDGLMDDVRIYNRSLTADEVKRLYTMGHTN